MVEEGVDLSQFCQSSRMDDADHGAIVFDHAILLERFQRPADGFRNCRDVGSQVPDGILLPGYLLQAEVAQIKDEFCGSCKNRSERKIFAAINEEPRASSENSQQAKTELWIRIPCDEVLE